MNIGEVHGPVAVENEAANLLVMGQLQDLSYIHGGAAVEEHL